MRTLTPDEKIRIGFILLRMTTPESGNFATLRNEMRERKLIDLDGNVLPDGMKIVDRIKTVAEERL